LKPRTKRALWIVAGLAGLGVATALVLNAFNDNMVFFYTPTQVADNAVPHNRAFRIGGLVEPGSLKREKDALTVRFVVTDGAKAVPVSYTGILPDLFKEGKGVVAQGRLGPDGFHASEVLAKHDENYMPPEAAEALRKGGHPMDKAAFAGQGGPR
jgi:cytochrome c-type biogenesis protein CcmE